MVGKCYTNWHIRVDNLSQAQYERFVNNAEYTKWMVIGNSHIKHCYGENDPRNGKEHYHVVFKYNNSRERQTIVNKFILDKKEDCASYYVEPMYARSNEAALIRYVSDKECGIKYIKGQQYIDHILNPKSDEELEGIIVQTDIIAKKTKFQLKEEKNKQRLENAKACNWKWFEENDFEFTLSPKYAKLYERYNTLNINDYLHLKLKGDTKKRFFILYGESRKGKGAFVEWLTKILNIDYYYFNKTDDYFNGCPSDRNDWLFHVDEWDGSESCNKTMPYSTIKEVFDKMPKKVRAAYCFDKIMRFGYGAITMQIHPKRAFFNKEKDFIEENWNAIANRFSIINVLQIPQLFSLTFNIEKECWEQQELNKVPDYLAKMFPWLIDEEGFPIFKEKQDLERIVFYPPDVQFEEFTNDLVDEQLKNLKL